MINNHKAVGPKHMIDEIIQVEFTEEELAELMKDLPRPLPLEEKNGLDSM